MSNIHPIFVHFPIALLSLSLVFEVLFLLRTEIEFSRVGWWLHMAGTLGLLLSVATGLRAVSEVRMSLGAGDRALHRATSLADRGKNDTSAEWEGNVHRGICRRTDTDVAGGVVWRRTGVPPRRGSHGSLRHVGCGMLHRRGAETQSGKNEIDSTTRYRLRVSAVDSPPAGAAISLRQDPL
jgi:hypothetical protein